jgi:hypothetical protein
MKRLAPKESGLLKKSIGQVVRTYRNGGLTIAFIGPRRGFRQVVMRKKPFGAELTLTPGEADTARDYPVMSDPVKYAHLVEYGTEPHNITSSGKAGLGKGHPGTKPQPFMRPAERKQPDANRVFIEGMSEGMAREAAKLIAKGK